MTTRTLALGRLILTLLVPAAVGMTSAMGCEAQNAIVGETCAPPLVACSGACLDLSTDSNNCGACGHACSAGAVCTAGACSLLDSQTTHPPRGDAGAPDAAGPSQGDASSGAPDGGDPATDAASADDGSAASDGGSTPPDGGSTPLDSGADAPVCSPPTVACGSTCVDTATDEYNCGGCGRFCPTFICQNSKCVGAVDGEVILIGHDYSTALPNGVPQVRVLTNAVFSRAVPSPHVLAYNRYASPQAVSNVDALLQSYASQRNYEMLFAETSDDDAVVRGLTAAYYDVLLIHDQSNAPAGTLGALGSAWQPVVSQFVKNGGTVVVLDAAGGTTQEMPALLGGLQLLSVTSQAPLGAASQVLNIAEADSVGSGVASPYRAATQSARFAIGIGPATADLTYVLVDVDTQAPVVVHKIIR